jgi:rubrerythrin
MIKISRRTFLYLSTVSPFVFQFPVFATQSKGDASTISYPHTILVLQEASKVEIIACKTYIGYTAKAMKEKYPNIAYLFHTFSYSENIHADNYKRILSILGQEVRSIQIGIDVRDTKTNLRKAAQNELKKIKTTYPGFLKELEPEAYVEAIIDCMYSWKSHQQHEEKVKEIAKYSGFFFGSVSSNIEGQNLDFYVCKVCGATINGAPHFPCTICNRSKANYLKIERPA